MKTLALCAGYGGLEMGLAEEADVELVAYAEFDDAPAAIMAHHHDGVTNLRDVTKIDWHALLALSIVVMTAGYPCQPFSHAGKRQGEDDPRHLWPHIARGIAILRPALCVFENVRGHLSLGFDRVLLDLDALGYDVRYYLLRAADVGACHGRARLFIFATDRAQQGAVIPPTAPAVALVQDGAWVEPESHLFGVEPFAGKLPACGWLHDGALYAQPKWKARSEAGPLFPTPTTWDGKNNAGPSTFGRNTVPLNALVTLLPTPAVNDMGAAYTPETWDAWTERQKAKHGNGNGHGKSLAIEAQRLLPTPDAYSGVRGGSQHPESGDLMLPSAVHHLLPTPEASDGTGGRRSAEYGGTRESGAKRAVTLATAIDHRWGDYGPAIARWEAVLGRPAPAPTEQDWEKHAARKARRLASTLPAGRRGSIRFLVDGPPHRLSARFVEWMQGLPEGWVTDVPGLTRNHQLKALGNGVVPQQAAAAYRAFLTDTRKAVAA